jgi:hypothetical protein
MLIEGEWDGAFRNCYIVLVRGIQKRMFPLPTSKPESPRIGYCADRGSSDTTEYIVYGSRHFAKIKDV